MDTIAVKYGLPGVVGHRVTGLGSVVCTHKVASDDLIGIEVEVENAANEVAIGGLNKAWQVKPDGSLRNDGLEFVTRPITAASAPVCLEYLMSHILKPSCCFSPRTSVHVHLNMQDFTPAQVQDYVMLYVIYERLFYKFVSKGRMKNIYCVPLCDTDLLSCMVELGDGRVRNWPKYTGLNTQPLTNFGTVEFRHMHGTFNVAKLTLWINLITRLKAYVRNTPTSEIRAHVSTMNDGYPFGELLEAIFGEFAGALRYDSVEELNYLQAKQILSSARTISKIRASATRESAYYKVKG